MLKLTKKLSFNENESKIDFWSQISKKFSFQSGICNSDSSDTLLTLVEFFKFIEIPKYFFGHDDTTSGGDSSISSQFEKLGNPQDFTRIKDKFIEDTDHALEEAKQKRLVVGAPMKLNDPYLEGSVDAMQLRMM